MKSILLACLLALPTIIFAQANYQPGFIIKNNGDTVKGYINYREWGYSPSSVEFKTDKGDKQAQLYSAFAIKEFKIAGYDTYISFVGKVSANKNIFPDIPVGLDTSTISSAIFLRAITTGKYLSLYYNNEVTKNRYFVSETNQPPVELKYYEYYDNTKTHETSHDLYRGQLLLYINKYNNGNVQLATKAALVDFEQEDLESVINAINGTTTGTQDSIARHAEKKSLSRFFLGAGIGRLATTYNYFDDNNNLRAHNANILGPKFTIGIDLFINPNIQQFIFRTELSASFATGHFTPSATIPARDELSYTQHAITLTPQILFNVYNTDSFKVYLDAGMAFSRSYYSDNGTGNNESGFQVRNFWGYVPVEAGVVLNKKVDVSFTLSSFNTTGSYNYVSVTNKLSEEITLKILLD